MAKLSELEFQRVIVELRRIESWANDVADKIDPRRKKTEEALQFDRIAAQAIRAKYWLQAAYPKFTVDNK